MQTNLTAAAPRETLSASKPHPKREETRADGGHDLELLLDSRAPIRAICWSGQRVVRVIREG